MSKRLILETIPPRGTNVDKFLSSCLEAASSGAQVIAVTDLPMGSSRVSPIAPAHLLLERGVDVLMHFSRTTRNAVRIEGDLIAAHMLGVRNVLILSGDDPRVGTYPFASSVEDFSIYDVFKLVKLLNEKGEDLAGLKVYGKFEFCPGGVFSPFEREVEGVLHRMRRKLESGCLFFVSQPIFSAETLLRFLEELEVRAPSLLKDAKIFAALMIFESLSQLEYFSKVPGVFVPREYFLCGSDGEVRKFSLRKAMDVIDKLTSHVQGFYLTATTRSADVVRTVASHLHI